MEVLNFSLWYLKNGYSIIPIQESGEDAKKPYIKWAKYQDELPTEDEVKTWWGKWPNAMIGIITGKSAKISVIDIDSYKLSNNQFEDYMREFAGFPKEIMTPIAVTPNGGFHFYFQYDEQIPQGQDIYPNVDGRNQGGYIIAPPSSANGHGKYAWLENRKIKEVAFATIPKNWLSKFNSINSLSLYTRRNINADLQGQQSQQPATIATLKFTQGARDQSLFHIANCLIKGGMQRENTEYLLRLISSNICDPPFSEKEVATKIESALKRYENKIQNLTQAIRDWVSVTWGNISVTNAQQDVTLRNIPEERAKIRVIMGRLVEEGIIERVPNQNGVFRKKEETIFEDWQSADTESLKIRLPFGLEQYAEIYPGDLIVFAGVKNAGKTAMALEMIRLNKGKFDCYYHSSELVKQTFRLRISKCEDTKLENWKDVKMSQGLSAINAPDRVVPRGFNVFDYVEGDGGEFYKIGSTMANIHRKLDNGVGIVCLQKKPGSTSGRGGDLTKDKAALYLLIDREYPYHVMRVDVIKAFKDGGQNPQGFYIKYKIVNGINLRPAGIWEPEC